MKKGKPADAGNSKESETEKMTEKKYTVVNAEKAIEVHKNMAVEIRGRKLIAEIDLDGEAPLSESGKSMMIVNLGRHGVNLPGGTYLQMNLGKWANQR